jgi:hypothetical protein
MPHSDRNFPPSWGLKVALSATSGYTVAYPDWTKPTMPATIERDAVGSRVRELREARNMTQDLIGVLGIANSALSRVESGERLTAAEFPKLAERR